MVFFKVDRDSAAIFRYCTSGIQLQCFYGQVVGEIRSTVAKYPGSYFVVQMRRCQEGEGGDLVAYMCGQFRVVPLICVS